jgi:hypothetical protein
MRILIWHVHGSYMTSFVQGPHRYLVPVLPDRGPDGRGRARTWHWPDGVEEIGMEQAADADVDVVVLQRPVELEGLARRWLGGRRPGIDVPAVYLEHNTPQGRIEEMRHPAADHDDLVVVHVTHFNDVFWDTGSTRTRVVEHGIVDPGHRYTGELERLAAVINEPVRRNRVTGTDLLGRFGTAGPVDLFGMGAAELGGIEDLPQHRLHDELARRRVFVHPFRWTSLGLSLLEAMHLGMPAVVLAATEAPEMGLEGAGILSTNVETLVSGAAELLRDRDAAREMGLEARRRVTQRYGLARFLADWDSVLKEVAA